MDSIQSFYRGKRPCKRCPFRNTAVIELAAGRMTEIVTAIEGDDESFPCHETTTKDIPDMMCVGALIFMIKRETLRGNLIMRMELWHGSIKPDELRGYDNIADSVEELEWLRVNHNKLRSDL